VAISLYKPGQGKWTRLLTGAGLGIVILTSAFWLGGEMNAIPDDSRRELWKTVMFAVVMLGGGALTYLALNRPRIADFMIATETEMKKVNWPSRSDIIGSTWVVIVGTLLMALFLFLVDLGFTQLFRQIRIIG
jgi:preprotein translocase subunit SecE